MIYVNNINKFLSNYHIIYVTNSVTHFGTYKLLITEKLYNIILRTSLDGSQLSLSKLDVRGNQNLSRIT